MTPEKFKELFVHRDDVYALQTNDGRYITQTRPLADINIIDHLNKKHTLGLYQLKEGLDGICTVKWAILDIDLNKNVYSVPNFDIKGWDEKLDLQVENVKQELHRHNVPSYIENSGGKGRHIWWFCEKPINAELIKTSMEYIYNRVTLVDKENIHFEIFPKQIKLTGGYGNLVKMPLSIHRRTGKESFFIDLIDEDHIDFITEDLLNHLCNPLDAIFNNCNALQNLRHKATTVNHLTNQERVVLSMIFVNLENGADYLEKEVLQYCSDYDPKKTKYYLDHASKKGYKPINCAKLQTNTYEHICNGVCKEIGASKSPIAFYYKNLGKDDYEFEKIEAKCRFNKYFISDNCYYEDTDKFGIIQISNFCINIIKELTIDDGINVEKILKGSINKDGEEIPFEITAEKYSNDQKFSAAIYSCIGNSNLFIDSIRKIRECTDKYTDAKKIYIKKVFGYNDELTTYYTPSVKITKDNIFKNDEVIIDLSEEDRAASLDLLLDIDNEFPKIKETILNDLIELADKKVIFTALSHTFLPIIFPFITGDKTRYIYFLRGLTGSGKSFIMKLLQNFYGNFNEHVSWTSTPNSIQKIGYFFKDTLFLVDDFKRSNLDRQYNAALQVMQNYADNSGRSRMKADSTLQQTYTIKGWLAITGEDSVEGEASNLARMITITLNTAGKDITRGVKVENISKKFGIFTARYIQYILNQDKLRLNDKFQSYLSLFYKFVEGLPNDVRMARNVALMTTSFDYLANFLWEPPQTNTKLVLFVEWMTELVKTLTIEAEEETAGSIFWDTFTDMLASKELWLQEDVQTEDTKNKSGLIGFWRDNHTYIKWIGTYQAIQTKLAKLDRKINHSPKAILDELYAKGLILDKKTIVRKMNGTSVRTVEIKL